MGYYEDNLMLKPLSHEEHCKNAIDLKKANFYLWRVWERCREAYGKNNKINNNLKFLLPHFMNSKMSKLLNLLDTEYHKVTSDEQFKRYGHVYFNTELDKGSVENDSI